jgi:hypothetical protein
MAEWRREGKVKDTKIKQQVISGEENSLRDS